MVLPRPELQFGALAIQELAETRAEGCWPEYSLTFGMLPVAATRPVTRTSRDLIACFARSFSSRLTNVVLFATIGHHPREARNPGTTLVHDIG